MTPHASVEPLEDRKLLAGNTLRVYFMGNSMTDQVRYAAFDELATSRGKDHVWGRQTILGSAISTIWQSPTSGFEQAPYGKYKTALPNYTWDAITLNPTDRDLFQADGLGDVQHATNFINYARQKNPDVQAYILQRTPRRVVNADGTFANIDYPTRFDKAYEYGDAYSPFAREYFNELVGTLRRNLPAGTKPVKLIPVGDVFYELDERIKAGQIPGVSNINAMYTDASHYTNLGAYVTALTFFATLYGENPMGLGVPSNFGGTGNIGTALRTALQDAVWDVVTSTPYTGVTRSGDPNRDPVAVAASRNSGAASTRAITFDGSASTDVDNDAITYHWRYGDGNSGSGKLSTYTYAAAGDYTATLTVSDGRGGTDVHQIPVSVGNTAPQLFISSPLIGLKYGVGDTIQFSGSATDAEDGNIAGSSLRWDVTMFANQSEYPILSNVTGSSGSFVANHIPQKDADRWYRVFLTARDSRGVERTIFTDVRPKVANLTIASNIAGTKFKLDQLSVTAGGAARVAGGTPYSLIAPATQTVDGKTYRFVSWSDGGAATHNIVAPTSDRTYTATYQLGTGTTPSAPTITTIKPSADATVRDGTYKSTNYGTQSTLLVKKSGGTNSGYNREAYLRFSLAGRPSGTPSAIKLRVYGKLDVTGATNLPVSVHSVSSTSWSEGSINFSNKPAAGATIKQFAVANTTSKWYEIDVTSYVKSQIAAGKTAVAFALRSVNSSGPIPTFVSREGGGNAPQLVITTPAPAAMPTAPAAPTSPFASDQRIVEDLLS